MYFEVQIEMSLDIDSVLMTLIVLFANSSSSHPAYFFCCLIVIWHSKHIKISAENLPQNADEFHIWWSF